LRGPRRAGLEDPEQGGRCGQRGALRSGAACLIVAIRMAGSFGLHVLLRLAGDLVARAQATHEPRRGQ
jgi:hypothetical protein